MQGLCQTALSLHYKQLAERSLFLFYLPCNVCHSLETEDGQRGALHPNQGSGTQRLCAENPDHENYRNAKCD